METMSPPLELRHRRQVRVEDSIRCGKETGMRAAPCCFRPQTWLEVSLIARGTCACSQTGRALQIRRRPTERSAKGSAEPPQRRLPTSSLPITPGGEKTVGRDLELICPVL